MRSHALKYVTNLRRILVCHDDVADGFQRLLHFTLTNGEKLARCVVAVPAVLAICAALDLHISSDALHLEPQGMRKAKYPLHPATEVACSEHPPPPSSRWTRCR